MHNYSGIVATAFLLALALSWPVTGQSQGDCTAISSSQARLECYDHLFQINAQEQPKDRMAFAKALEVIIEFSGELEIPDLAAGSKFVVKQWMDFEIVEDKDYENS